LPDPHLPAGLTIDQIVTQSASGIAKNANNFTHPDRIDAFSKTPCIRSWLGVPQRLIARQKKAPGLSGEGLCSGPVDAAAKANQPGQVGQAAFW